jgi:hypothetical protein
MTAEGYSPQRFFYVGRAVRMGSGHEVASMCSAKESASGVKSLGIRLEIIFGARCLVRSPSLMHTEVE